MQSKIEAARAKVEAARQRVEEAIINCLPAYIVRSRRNTLVVACSDLAMAEAFNVLERE
jgi:hypothetical protein